MCKYFSLSGMFQVLRPVKYNIIQAVLTITSNHNIVRLFKLFSPSSTLSALSPRYVPDRLLQNLFLTSSCVFLFNIGLRYQLSDTKGPSQALSLSAVLFLSSLFAEKPKVKSLQRRQLSDHLLKDVMVDLTMTWILAGSGRSTASKQCFLI